MTHCHVARSVYGSVMNAIMVAGRRTLNFVLIINKVLHLTGSVIVSDFYKLRRTDGSQLGWGLCKYIPQYGTNDWPNLNKHNLIKH